MVLCCVCVCLLLMLLLLLLLLLRASNGGVRVINLIDAAPRRPRALYLRG